MFEYHVSKSQKEKKKRSPSHSRINWTIFRHKVLKKIFINQIKFGLEPLLVLVVASVLLWTNRGLSFYYIATEPFSASVLNFTIGSMFLALRLNNWKSYLLLCILTFFLYQIRPAFTFIAALIPLWAVGISLLFNKTINHPIIKIFLRFSALTLLPLFIFCFLITYFLYIDIIK